MSVAFCIYSKKKITEDRENIMVYKRALSGKGLHVACMTTWWKTSCELNITKVWQRWLKNDAIRPAGESRVTCPVRLIVLKRCWPVKTAPLRSESPDTHGEAALAWEDWPTSVAKPGPSSLCVFARYRQPHTGRGQPASASVCISTDYLLFVREEFRLNVSTSGQGSIFALMNTDIFTRVRYCGELVTSCNLRELRMKSPIATQLEIGQEAMVPFVTEQYQWN